MSNNIDEIIKNFNNLSCFEKNNIKNKKINWKHILPNMKLTEQVLESFSDQIEWNDVIRFQDVSQIFINSKKYIFIST